MHDSQHLHDKNDKDIKHPLSSRRIFFTSGIGVILIGIIAPLFQWYVIMRATCGPSNDLCGLETGWTMLFFSLPCAVLGIILILLGILSSIRKRS